jgi:hypothetical protein
MKLLSFITKLIVRKPDEKARALELMKVTRFEVFENIITKLPPHLLPSGNETTLLLASIAEQVNWATASTQFEGSDEEMLQKLDVIWATLHRNGAGKAAEELIGAVKMRPHYLDHAASLL